MVKVYRIKAWDLGALLSLQKFAKFRLPQTRTPLRERADVQHRNIASAWCRKCEPGQYSCSQLPSITATCLTLLYTRLYIHTLYTNIGDDGVC